MAPLQICRGTNMRVRRTTMLLISLTLIGVLVPPHTRRGATLPMPDLGLHFFDLNENLAITSGNFL